MGPNIHLYQQVLAERHGAFQHEGEQRRMLAGQRLHRSGMGRHLIGMLGIALVALGSRMEQFERQGEPMWNQSRS